MARRPDPHIAERMRAEAFFRRQERKLFTGVMTAMTAWLDDARTLLLGDTYLPPNLTAAGNKQAKNIIPAKIALTAAADQPDFTNINASFETWRRGLQRHIEPVINETFGEAFAAHSRNADISPTHWQEHHMATVHDRLKIWPENAFEELRPELLEAMAQNEDYDAITDRIGRTLNIDAPSRRIRADISAIDRKLADPTTPTTEIAGLKGRRRTLWNQHDESLLDWQWKARRIARTECLPADSPINAANITAVYRRHYEGQWIEIHTASGRKIAGTPNHPVLTSNGWKGLAEVTESDDLVCYENGVENSGAPGDEHVQDAPPTIGEVFNAIAAVTVVEREAGAEPDFHGDGREGYVDVLRPDWLLRVGDFTTITESCFDSSLTPSDHRKISGFAERSSFARDVSVPHGMSLLEVSDWDARSDQSSTDGASVHSIPSGERSLRFTGHVQPNHLVDVDVDFVDDVVLDVQLPGLGQAPHWSVCGVQDVVNGGSVASHLDSDRVTAEPGLVKLDNVIRVDVRSFCGHVFNVTTVEGYYSGPLGIVTSNTHGAIQAGTWASAEATAQITGEKLYKAFLATHDERTRGEHVIADGQIVPISTSFSVAGYPMMYPGDPFAPAHLVVNCRCSMRILTESEVQDELQGMWGGRGVGPGNARLGPDLADDITVAIDRWKREQKGEVVGDNRPPGQVERDAKREAPDRLNPGWSEQDTVRPYEGNPVPIVDPEPDDPYAPLVINIGGDDLPDEPEIDTDIDLPDEDEDDVEPFGNSEEFNDPDDDTVEPGDRPLHQQFDDHFTDTIDNYTPEQRDAINKWQGMDRFYQRVQKVVRDPDFEDDEAAEVVDLLNQVIEQAVLPDDTTLWRGVRDSYEVFGIVNADLPQLIGETIQSPGFLAASTSRDVAIQFMQPSLRGGHVLMELRFPAGLPVAWISGAGTPELADQYEALFGTYLAVHMVSVEYTGTVPTVVAEVIPNDGNAG